MGISDLSETTEHVFDAATFKFLQEKVVAALNQCRDKNVRKELIEIATLVALKDRIANV